MNSKFKILYIIGAGRSGTTLLDIVLGNANNFFSAGELNRFTKRDGKPHDPRDKDVNIFWMDVNKLLFTKDFRNPRYYYELFKRFEYHSSYFKIHSSLKSKHFETYAHYQQELFSAIYSNSPQNDEITIIDSSKYPLRGFFLSKIFGNRVSLLYVKRQPSATVESFQKKDVEQPSKSRFSAHIYLLVVNMIAHKIIQLVNHSNKTCTICYEQFIQFPFETLEKIEKDLAIDLTKSKKIVKTTGTFKVGVLFDGNRLRLKQEINFSKHSGSNNKSEHLLNKLFLPLHKLTWYKL